MKLNPLGDRVVLEPLAVEETTKGGLVLPDTVDKEKPEQGKVIAVGPGKTTVEGKVIPLGVKVGDIVLFTKYGPTEVKVDENEYLIVGSDDILAVIS